MSRVGKMPIAIPAGVTVTVTPENVVTVKGPKGELVKAMHKDINIAVEDAQVVVTRPSDVKEHRALHGLTRALLNNMVVGVSQGFSKTLKLEQLLLTSDHGENLNHTKVKESSTLMKL